ncbi:HPP family protein [Embleya sp. NPDC020630]|uniref:HPP family protein n=1 Tax=Embleya sp. NPDC020630 TaxID=3363979 RepID=UPI003799F42D
MSEVMSAPVAYVALTDTPRRAHELMLALGLRHLVVVDPGNGEAVGVLRDRDLAEPRALHRCRHLGWGPRTVTELLRRCVPIVRPEIDVLTAIESMLDAGVDALVVSGRSRLPLGIVTNHDLARVLTRIHDEVAAGCPPDGGVHRRSGGYPARASCSDRPGASVEGTKATS